MDAKTIKRLKQFNDELARTLVILREIRNILRCDEAMKGLEKMLNKQKTVGL